MKHGRSWLSALLISFSILSFAQKEPVDYVNTIIGASTSAEAGKSGHGLGKTFPGSCTPFGLVQLSPDTKTGGDNGPGYSWHHSTIEGFSFTHLSGIGWYGDFGNFLVMPTTGPLRTFKGTENKPEEGYRSRYSHDTEITQAGYYSVYLQDYQVKVELTSAPRSGILRFTYPESEKSRIQIDLARRIGGTSDEQYVEKVDEYTIRGWMKCTPACGGWGNGSGKSDYTVYFYCCFDRPLTEYGVWSASIPEGVSRKNDANDNPAYFNYIKDARIIPAIGKAQGKHLGFYTEFPTRKDEQVQLKCGISFVSMEGAQRNLEQDIPDWNFERVKENTRNLWNQALSSVKVEGSERDKTIFYTSLYHTMIDPRIYTDVDGQYMGADGKAHKSDTFTKRTIFSGWDVFRSQMPLQTIINPVLVNDLLKSLTTMAEESGREYYERWELLNAYSGCMLGNPAISVLADAYAKGICSLDMEKAYRYADKTSRMFGNAELGYTPNPQSISKTLEYAYTEWCMSQLAKSLGKQEDAAYYAKLAQSYRNLYDAEKHSFRPREANGRFEAWPEEGKLKEWYGCMECNELQQGWFVPHDIPGMVELMGGTERVIADLDTMFDKTPTDFLWNAYYNHANEPVHHVPFLYNHLGQPWKTQKWSRFICDKAYKNKVEGLVGNEDVGQMSAWYVLAACGLYPVCPGDTRYEISSPVFEKTEIQVGEGNTFIIRANRNTPENTYIQSAKLNGMDYTRCYLDYKDIMKGGVLELEMGPTPDKTWGIE